MTLLYVSLTDNTLSRDIHPWSHDMSADLVVIVPLLIAP